MAADTNAVVALSTRLDTTPRLQSFQARIEISKPAVGLYQDIQLRERDACSPASTTLKVHQREGSVVSTRSIRNNKYRASRDIAAIVIALRRQLRSRTAEFSSNHWSYRLVKRKDCHGYPQSDYVPATIELPG